MFTLGLNFPEHFPSPRCLICPGSRSFSGVKGLGLISHGGLGAPGSEFRHSRRGLIASLKLFWRNIPGALLGKIGKDNISTYDMYFRNSNKEKSKGQCAHILWQLLEAYRLQAIKLVSRTSLLWMEEILHHPRSPQRMVITALWCCKIFSTLNLQLAGCRRAAGEIASSQSSLACAVGML